MSPWDVLWYSVAGAAGIFALACALAFARAAWRSSGRQ